MSTASRRKNRPPAAAPAPAVVSAEPPVTTGTDANQPQGRIGDILRRVRESRGEYIEAISNYIKVRPHYLYAMEASRYQDLPADTYAIGFLRTYADYLGLDGKAAVAQFRREISGRRRQPELHMPQPIPEGRAPTTAMVVGGLCFALVIYGIWYSLAATDRATVTPPTLPTTTSSIQPNTEATMVTTAPAGVGGTALAPPAPTQAVTVPTTANPAAPSPQPTPQATTQPNVNPVVVTPPPPTGQIYGDVRQAARVELRVIEESWIMITNTEGKNIFDKILRPGDSYKVPNINGLKLTTGNGAGVRVYLDGRELPPLGDKGRVVRDVSLDGELLQRRSLTPQ